jgi:putative NADPH-quinone reductase
LSRIFTLSLPPCNVMPQIWGGLSAILKRYVSNIRQTFAHPKRYVWYFRLTSLLLEHNDAIFTHTIGNPNDLFRNPDISCCFKNAMFPISSMSRWLEILSSYFGNFP